MKLGFAAAAAALAWAMPASAANNPCEVRCTYDPEFFPGGQFPFDFTIGSNQAPGVVWQLRYESADPNARVFLPGPNYANVFNLRRTETGIESEYLFDSQVETIGFSFEQVDRPGLVTAYLRFDRPFDRCSEPGPVGEICGRSFELIGNGTTIGFQANAPVDFTFSEMAMVPEPATWAMMIGGFGLVGAAARRRARVSAALV